MSVTAFAIAAFAVLLGACLQGALGFGLGMLGGPILALLDPTLIPGPLLLLATALTLIVAVRERAELDLSGAKWALLGRVPGTVAGAVLVAYLPARILALVLAGVVLVGTAISAFGWVPRPTRNAVIVAGMASGAMGTATAIGGPPMALVWQDSAASSRRATMSAFFLAGCIMSVAALTVSGTITATTVVSAAQLLPFLLLGYGASLLLNRHLNQAKLRTLALTLSATGATLLALRQL
ncbi:hypothetical protein SAMN05216266_101373 [Amycolatopsis marina]|uniref:Probable membrane transporter protein n=1 Tax=Amycolatopsis marina TaxID=490629 RepID=A0A1I0VPS9_9PSEU|nr:TSUP family transporter [Amycolatopsis marina]SFA77890.1 hypothetical protein SAMN05216266_101373 [Amycolatopsis marina]